MPAFTQHRPWRMELTRTNGSPSRWRWALKGGLIALAVPFILGMAFSLTMDEGAQEGIGWIFVAAILASPIIFGFGAAGGLFAHTARNWAAAAPVGAQTTRTTRAGWILCGGLAGYAASALTSVQWPIVGGLLIGVALIPIWIWIGAALGWRVAVTRSSRRPTVGALVVAGAAYALIDTLFSIPQLHINHGRASLIAAMGSLAVALFTRIRLIAAQ